MWFVKQKQKNFDIRREKGKNLAVLGIEHTIFLLRYGGLWPMLNVQSEESTNISRVHLVPKVLSCSILTLRYWFGLMPKLDTV